MTQTRYHLALDLMRDRDGYYPILDVGGGSGTFFDMAGRKNLFAWGSKNVIIDKSQVSLWAAEKKGYHVRLVDLNSSLGLPFPSEHFRTSVALDVLEHLRDPAFVLKEMLRVSKEAVIVVPNFSYWKQRLQVLRGRYPALMRPSRKHCYWMNPKALTCLVEEAGGKIDQWKYSCPVRFGKTVGWILAHSWPTMFAPALGVRVVKGDKL